MAYTEDELHEVTSWMEDEGRSVTIASVSQSLKLSRSQAQLLLEQLGERKGVSAYRVTEKTSEEIIGDVVFRLLSPASKDGYMYAVTEKESLATAHERDMDQMRDMLKNNQLHNLTAGATDAILPAEQVIPMMEHNSQSSDRPIVSSLDRSKAAAPVKKVTTAESFFQKKSTPAATKPSATKEGKKEPSKETKRIDPSSKTVKAKETSKENEKENQASKVGRVDDFVGDEDDSDEDPMEVDAAPRKKIIRGRKQPNQEEEEKQEAKEKESAVPVWGAMDDFATEAKRPTAQPATGTSGRRRRKKLVQKTSMDAQGYLHTETQEIWEDIPSDEEDEPVFVAKQSTTQQTSTKKVALKQGSLMGFFTKK